MTIFYCVRHGKTLYNQQSVFQGGRADSPLLPSGRENARLLGLHLQSIPFDRVIVSPQKRALDTAQLIIAAQAKSLPLIKEPRLKEMSFGGWDGLPEKHFYHETEFQHLVYQPHRYNPAINGGESFAEVRARGFSCLTDYTQKYPTDTILLVAHGLFLQTLLKSLQGVPLADIRRGEPLANTSVTTVLANPKTQSFTIDRWNETPTHTKTTDK